MTTTRPEVVKLIADCLRNHDTRIRKIATWKHASGEPVTETEVGIIKNATLYELEAAVHDCSRSSQ